MNKINFFSADYRDGRVHIGGKSYPVGTFAAHLLNNFYENDTAARIAVYTTDNWQTGNMLKLGYLNINDYVKAGERLANIFYALPKIKPFDMLDTDNERNRITELFTETNGNSLSEYFLIRAKIGQMDKGQVLFHNLPNGYDENIFALGEKLLKDVNATLHFYDTLSDDICKVFEQLSTFVNRIDEAKRFDEEHLLPIALEIFGSVPFTVTTEYVPIPKTARSKVKTLARRLYFANYYSFIITDFLKAYTSGIIRNNVKFVKDIFL